MTVCNHPVDGHMAHGPWCETATPVTGIPADAITVPLTKGYTAIIDAADEKFILQYAWHARVDRSGKIYAGTGKSSRRMHALLTGWPLTDHENGNGLDNRRCNLRPATRSQNHANAPAHRNNTSGYKGVWLREGRWTAAIRVNGKRLMLGRYDTPELAAMAYDQAAINAYGNYALTNFGRAT